ncbi:2TM domain-containing protein [Flavobacterium defluvii]|uniref:2TM domain-containing protein n=1 Tax=Flavobacterium defluvii TaxID=370979 RepID=A0A1M5IQB8_9FLAO|nr:2TM domain-containing protein [Flavobacterium defluvii]SHG30518.1 2TM domain-containing protein [Flavobacterium defluvii]
MRHLVKEHTSAHIEPKKGFRIHLLVFVLTAPLLWLAWLFTDKTYLWPLWQNTAWGIGLLFHFLGVYILKKDKK